MIYTNKAQEARRLGANSIGQIEKHLNKERALIMHIDLNSAFASAEQQAWPLLRNRPMGVTNRLSKECCVIAASYEAKALGIKVGVRRAEAMAICPDFVMLETDPSKYTHMYKSLIRIMKDYSPNIKMKSIDEGIIDFHGCEQLLGHKTLMDVGYEIKQRVYQQLGNHMRINIGIGTNRFLAKQAAGWHKPDGLDQIDHKNLIAYYVDKNELEDITGIADAYGARLRAHGVTNNMEFLQANDEMLRKRVFKSINGMHWSNRLRGFEVDDYDTKLGMVGRQWVIAKPSNDDAYLRSCLHYLSDTTGTKLRYRNRAARGVCVWAVFNTGGYWRDKRIFKTSFFTNQDIWEHVSRLFDQRPKHMVLRTMGLYVYQLTSSSYSQLGLFDDIPKKLDLSKALDEINDFYGSFTLFSADTLTGTKTVKQKIPFGCTEYFDLLLKRA